MCMVSQVYDQWRPAFPPALQPIYPWAPITQPAQPSFPKRYTVEELRRLIEAFEKALRAARVFDEVTGQPDCEDAEKAGLLGRVAELEERLVALEARGA